MRSSLAFVIVTTLAACGGTSRPAGQDSADAGADPANPDAGALQPPARGFQIVSPNVDIPPGVEVTYCYYFRTPNTTDLQIKRWASHMTPGSHHMIMYLTSSAQPAPGTLTTDACGLGASLSGLSAVWTYSAQNVDAEQALPADDGKGMPVGQTIKAGQLGFVQMHYLNASDAVIHAHVELNAYAYDEGVQVTPAAPFVTYNTRISLAPGNAGSPTSGSVTGTCAVPSDNGSPLRFYMLTTHVHKQGIHTFVKDGEATVFDSTSWEHPGTITWNTPPFYMFSSGRLTYQCDYLNPNNRTITTGDSAATDEMCMAIGYFFPAAGGTGHFCLNSAMVY